MQIVCASGARVSISGKMHVLLGAEKKTEFCVKRVASNRIVHRMDILSINVPKAKPHMVAAVVGAFFVISWSKMSN